MIAAAVRDSSALGRATSKREGKAAEEAFAKIVWRRAPAFPASESTSTPVAFGAPSGTLQRDFAALQVRPSDEAVGIDPAASAVALATASPARAKSEPEACSCRSESDSPRPARSLESDSPRPARGTPTVCKRDQQLCCSPSCALKLCCGCEEEHAGPHADSGYDSETTSDTDGEDGEDETPMESIGK